jgi:hypothetical protein
VRAPLLCISLLHQKKKKKKDSLTTKYSVACNSTSYNPCRQNSRWAVALYSWRLRRAN